MTGWNRNMMQDRDVLMRIVALLIGFARLAELASGLPASRRRQLLGILAYSEAVGREFMLGMAHGAMAVGASEVPGATESDGYPAPPGCDAPLLAATFRVLALALYTMLVGHSVPTDPGGLQERRLADPLILVAHATLHRRAALPVPDTS